MLAPRSVSPSLCLIPPSADVGNGSVCLSGPSGHGVRRSPSENAFAERTSPLVQAAAQRGGSYVQ